MDTKKDNAQPDVFSNLVQSKLQNHQIPVDDACWNEIEQRLQKKDKRKIVWWLWLPVSSAAVIALIFTLLPSSEPVQYAQIVEKPGIATVNTKQSIVAQLHSNTLTQTATQPSTLKIDTKTNSSKPEVVKKSNAENEHETDFINQPQIDPISEETSVSEVPKSTDIQPIEEPAKKMNSKLTSLPTQEEKNDWNIDNKKNKQNNWMLAASIGSGSGISLNGQNDEMYYSVNDKGSGLSDAQASYTNAIGLDDFPEKTYNTPLTFGLTVRKNLNQTLSLETGFTYTYLLSSFKKDLSMQRYDAKLHLHYIGIPLNLIVQIWNKSNWELYLSGGTTVEKGIQSVYIQNQHIGNSIYTTTVKEKVDGLQWSLNGAVGATYKINRNIGIYFEPKLSYFFDNNQPVSARTNQTISVGLAAGLRLGF